MISKKHNVLQKVLGQLDWQFEEGSSCLEVIGGKTENVIQVVEDKRLSLENAGQGY